MPLPPTGRGTGISEQSSPILKTYSEEDQNCGDHFIDRTSQTIVIATFQQARVAKVSHRTTRASKTGPSWTDRFLAARSPACEHYGNTKMKRHKAFSVLASLIGRNA